MGHDVPSSLNTPKLFEAAASLQGSIQASVQGKSTLPKPALTEFQEEILIEVTEEESPFSSPLSLMSQSFRTDSCHFTGTVGSSTVINSKNRSVERYCGTSQGHNSHWSSGGDSFLKKEGGGVIRPIQAQTDCTIALARRYSACIWGLCQWNCSSILPDEERPALPLDGQLPQEWKVFTDQMLIF